MPPKKKKKSTPPKLPTIYVPPANPDGLLNENTLHIELTIVRVLKLTSSIFNLLG